MGAILRGLGARVVDADAIVRRLQTENASIIRAIHGHFGPAVVVNGRLDRAELARIVFADPSKLSELEALLHPAVGVETARLINELTDAPLTFVEAIKVVEGPTGDRLDGLWVVDADSEQQIARVVAQRGMAESDARARLAAQSPVDAKIAAFHMRRPGRPMWRIHNVSTMEDLRTAVRSAWTETLRAFGKS